MDIEGDKLVEKIAPVQEASSSQHLHLEETLEFANQDQNQKRGISDTGLQTPVSSHQMAREFLQARGVDASINWEESFNAPPRNWAMHPGLGAEQIAAPAADWNQTGNTATDRSELMEGNAGFEHPLISSDFSLDFENLTQLDNADDKEWYIPLNRLLYFDRGRIEKFADNLGVQESQLGAQANLPHAATIQEQVGVRIPDVDYVFMKNNPYLPLVKLHFYVYIM